MQINQQRISNRQWVTIKHLAEPVGVINRQNRSLWSPRPEEPGEPSCLLQQFIVHLARVEQRGEKGACCPQSLGIRCSGRETRQASGQGWSPTWEESGPLCALCIVPHKEEEEERQEFYCNGVGGTSQQQQTSLFQLHKL